MLELIRKHLGGCLRPPVPDQAAREPHPASLSSPHVNPSARNVNLCSKGTAFPVSGHVCSEGDHTHCRSGASDGLSLTPAGLQEAETKDNAAQIELDELSWARAGLEASSSLQVVITDAGQLLGSSEWLKTWKPSAQDEALERPGVYAPQPDAPGAGQSLQQAALAQLIGAEHGALALQATAHGLPYRACITFTGTARLHCSASNKALRIRARTCMVGSSA